MNVGLALLFILISSIFGAFSTLLFKMGSALKINIKNYKLMGAFGLAAFSFTFYIYALQQASLTFIYLTASVSYLWAIILAKVVLKEDINKYKIIGIVFILFGIAIMHI
jgi:drug/metabolite transporter (DMT)-like permease